MRPSRIFLAVVILAAGVWGAYRAYRAHANLVTLTVRNMDVQRVVSKLEWQTWEKIVLSKGVSGKVTLQVHNVPLEEVLNIVGLQTDSRWTRLYPLYASRKSLATFQKVLQGNVPPAGNGWSALQQMAVWQQAGLGSFANTLRAENKLVSAQVAAQDVTFTALALSRFSRAQVVPEDNTKGVISLKLQQVPFEKAVGKVARQVHRKWSRVYTLQPLNQAVLVRQTSPAAPAPNTASVADSNIIQAAAAPEARTLSPELAWEALASTMTPEEKQQTLDLIAAANSGGAPASGGGQPQLQGVPGGTQPQMQAAPGGGQSQMQAAPGGGQSQMQAASAAAAQAAQAAQQDLQRRIELRLKDGTVDQRIAHDRRVLDSKQKGAKQ
jgi:hypothetical protein